MTGYLARFRDLNRKRSRRIGFNISNLLEALQILDIATSFNHIGTRRNIRQNNPTFLIRLETQLVKGIRPKIRSTGQVRFRANKNFHTCSRRAIGQLNKYRDGVFRFHRRSSGLTAIAGDIAEGQCRQTICPRLFYHFLSPAPSPIIIVFSVVPPLRATG